MYKYIAVFFIPIICFSNFLFEEPPKVDSLSISDTTIVVDTVKRYPIHSHGSIYNLKSGLDTKINRRDIQMQNYIEFSDIIYYNFPAFKMSLGSFGMNNVYSFNGGMTITNGTMLNGRNINDLAFSSHNPYQISTEFAENFEVMTGANAVVFGGKSGSIINMQEPYFNSAKPFTRVWFAQAGSEFLGVDALISQNIAKNWNYSFGFRSTAAAGKFDNTWLKAWNVRLVLKWSPSDRTSISLVEYFTNHGTGLNGGNDINSENLYDPISASPIFPQINERIYRHDLNLNFTSLLSEDSTHSLSLAVFYTNTEHNFTFYDDIFFNPSDSSGSIRTDNYYIGAMGKYELSLSNFLTFRAGGNFQYSYLPKTYINQEFTGTDFAAYGHLDFDITNGLNLSGGARLFTENGIFGLGIGGKLRAKLTDSSAISFDLSLSDRTPAASENLDLFNEKHLLGIFNFNYINKDLNIEVGVFSRLIDNPISYISTKDTLNLYDYSFKNDKTKLILGGFFNYKSQFINLLRYEFQLQSYYDMLNSEQINSFPLLYGKLNVYYEYLLNRSIVQLGTEIEALTSYKGLNYNPINRAYTQNFLKSDFQQNGLNIYANLKLARAFVKVAFNNLLASNYYYIPYYPNLSRNLRLTVGWSFND